MTTDPTADRYRRRRRWPILTVLGVLFLGGGYIWFQALKPEPSLGTGCNTPGAAPATTSQSARSSAATSRPSSGASRSSAAARTTATTRTTPTTLGAFTDKNTLAQVRPAAPDAFTLNVFNASQQRGLAKTLSDELRTLGFDQIGTVTNDPLYPANDLRCVGEIRYGNAGVASARTALMLMPCAQLVVDNRVDESVDVAIGALYTFDTTPDAVKAQLAAIGDAAAPPPVFDGRTVQLSRSALSIPPLPSAACPS